MKKATRSAELGLLFPILIKFKFHNPDLFPGVYLYYSNLVQEQILLMNKGHLRNFTISQPHFFIGTPLFFSYVVKV